MEPCLYDDFYLQPASSPMDEVRKQKRRLTLDLSGSRGGGDGKSSSAMRSLLTSPDVRMLKLGSPELERLILQQSSLVSATPTPGGPQALNSVLGTTGAGSVTRPVTEEQESYARGFIDALQDLKQQEQQHYSRTFSEIGALDSPAFYASLQSAVTASVGGPGLLPLPQLTPIKQEPHTAPPHHLQHPRHQQHSHQQVGAQHQPYLPSSEDLHHLQPPVAFRPQSAASSSSTAAETIPSTGEDDGNRLERKRMRNRIAATKCRHRKLERISQLEDQVDRIRKDNAELHELAVRLRQQVDDLKREVVEHSRHGCQIVFPASVVSASL